MHTAELTAFVAMPAAFLGNEDTAFGVLSEGSKNIVQFPMWGSQSGNGQ